MIPVHLNPLTEMVQIAVQARPTEAYALNPLQARDEEVAASKQLLALAPDYTADSLISSISCFITQLCGSPPENLEELKPCKVYASRSQKVVVKVFAPNKGEDGLYKFVREISGQSALADLELTTGTVVKVLSAGKCMVEGQNTFLLALSLAPGHEVKQSLDAIFTSPEKEPAIVHCQHVLRRLGEVLAEVHARKSVTFNTSQENATYARREMVAQIDKDLNGYASNGGALVGKLRAVFAEKLAQSQSTCLTVAQGHGDSHLKNFIYDPETDQITIIDTTRAHLWADPQGAPLHPVHLQDIARTIDDIAKWTLHKTYDPPLIERLTQSFKEGYFARAPQFISPAELDLKVSVAFLARLKSAALWDIELTEGAKLAKKRIYQYYLSKLLNKEYRVLTR